MKKFFVLFCIPAAAIQEWMATVDEATRTQQTQEMMQSWQKWLADHESMVVDHGLPLGKTKRVTKDGVADARNDLNYYIMVEAESHEAAANMFVGHPHLDIPTSYIEVIDASRPGM